MHFTDTVYRNPYWPTFPLLQITHGNHKVMEAIRNSKRTL